MKREEEHQTPIVANNINMIIDVQGENLMNFCTVVNPRGHKQ